MPQRMSVGELSYVELYRRNNVAVGESVNKVG
jgi:hypothetical protein